VADEVLLPRAAEAEISEDKLRDYALDPDHPTGRHKVRVFAATLGIRQTDWAFLRDEILERVTDSPVTAIRPKPPFGMSTRLGSSSMGSTARRTRSSPAGLFPRKPHRGS
jgi:hypothetical protein